MDIIATIGTNAAAINGMYSMQVLFATRTCCQEYDIAGISGKVKIQCNIHLSLVYILNVNTSYLKDVLWDKYKVHTTKPDLRKNQEDIDEISKNKTNNTSVAKLSAMPYLNSPKKIVKKCLNYLKNPAYLWTDLFGEVDSVNSATSA